MQVTYPTHHRWQRSISDDPLAHLSTRTAGKIRTALKELVKNGVHYDILPLSEAFLDLFLPLYTEHIGRKSNGVIHDVFENTLGKEASSFPYYAFSLYENGEFIGGTIFSLRPDRLSFAYRMFLPRWKQADLKISPAYIGEFATAEFALQHGLSIISHGRDRNPYGQNASIGLATFKLSAGCNAYVSSGCEIKVLDTDSVNTDILILTAPLSGNQITKAYLVTSRENLMKYIQVTKYPNQLAVEVLYRD
ncbi:MAG: hypothetical protein AAB618_02455 [Patescibacteria group bacterium]